MQGGRAAGLRVVGGVLENVHAHVDVVCSVERAERMEEVGDVGDDQLSVAGDAVDRGGESLTDPISRELYGALTRQHPTRQRTGVAGTQIGVERRGRGGRVRH